MSQQLKDILESQVHEDRETTPSGSLETITQDDYISIHRHCESVDFLQEEANRRDVTPPEGFQERVFRCLVMTRYEKLESVNSVDEFKKVFVDVMRGTFCCQYCDRSLMEFVDIQRIVMYIRHPGFFIETSAPAM